VRNSNRIDPVRGHCDEILFYRREIVKLTPILSWSKSAVGDAFNVKLFVTYKDELSPYGRTTAGRGLASGRSAGF
jgi:hypothetical protein